MQWRLKQKAISMCNASSKMGKWNQYNVQQKCPAPLFSLFFFPMYTKVRKPKRMKDAGNYTNRRRAWRRIPVESAKTNLAGFTGAIYELLTAEYRPGKERRVQLWAQAARITISKSGSSQKKRGRFIPFLLIYQCWRIRSDFSAPRWKQAVFKCRIEDKYSRNNDRLYWHWGWQAGFHLAQQQP